MRHSKYLHSFPIVAPRMTSGRRYCCVWMSSVKWWSVRVARRDRKRGETKMKVSSKLKRTDCETNNEPLPRSAILPVILACPLGRLELDVSSPKHWLGIGSMAMTDVDNGISDVAGAKPDGVIDVSEGTPTAEPVAVLMCDGASSCVGNEGLGVSMGAVSTCYRTRSITVLSPHPSPHRASIPPSPPLLSAHRVTSLLVSLTAHVPFPLPTTQVYYSPLAHPKCRLVQHRTR